MNSLAVRARVCLLPWDWSLCLSGAAQASPPDPRHTDGAKRPNPTKQKQAWLRRWPISLPTSWAFG